MAMHERTWICKEAALKLDAFMSELGQTYQLTPIESARILQSKQDEFLTYVLRDERHPKSDKYADEA